jgi:hypothetical protein
MRLSFRIVALAAAAAAASCGDVARTGRSPVQLVVVNLLAAKGDDPTKLFGYLQSDVLTKGTVFNDVGSADLQIQVKNPGIAPSTLNQVTVDRVHIKYVRADGHNIQGVDVPYEFDGAATGTLKQDGTISTLTFEIVRHVAKIESPLVQLDNSPNIITTIGQVTFYGHDQAGNEMNVTGQIQIDFANFADSTSGS